MGLSDSAAEELAKKIRPNLSPEDIKRQAVVVIQEVIEKCAKEAYKWGDDSGDGIGDAIRKLK